MKIAIVGAGGRMGKTLIETLLEDGGLLLAAAIDQPGSLEKGKDAGESFGKPCGVFVTDDADAGIEKAGCLIDFTRPQGTLVHLSMCLRHKKPIVIGTTGFDEAGKREIAEAAKEIPIVFAPNMSIGVNATLKLIDIAARILSDGYDVEIIEAHHKHKVDAPSGTAIRMGEIVALALGLDFKESALYGREGAIGERDPKTIGFSAIRGGDIVGDHTVMFCGDGERIEITHRSASRKTYALGALRAARFLSGKKNGLFDMQDVLGLR
ncbi:MAG: 4-hydroxy-tetrahydrodipicolinate reductase [Candidatus Accumulibacter sp.]|jgi:4-hydroxy-tetrahydrodipicolinate reductase|nr:4-hydroxy-tetrahydrodipicolinate reductase [Accumulibacter sp.]